MRNRFLMYEVYEEWVRAQDDTQAMGGLRHRLAGILAVPARDVPAPSSPTSVRSGCSATGSSRTTSGRGLMQYFDGVSATQLSSDQMLSDLDAP